MDANINAKDYFDEKEGASLKKHSLCGKNSSLGFIKDVHQYYERCHTTETPCRMRKLFSNENNIQFMMLEDEIKHQIAG